jgi:metal transporter CNNM
LFICPFLELIGEEIYDEFDPEGHPDLKSYAQNDKANPSTVKHKLSAPELAGNSAAALPAGALNRDMTRSLTATALIKPIALPASLKGLNFRGLGFARSRSAPPTPRDEKEQVLPDKGDGTPATVPEGSLPDETVINEDEDVKRAEVPDDSCQMSKMPYEGNPEQTLPLPTCPGSSLVNADAGPLLLPGIARIRSNAPIRAPVPIPASALSPPSTVHAPLAVPAAIVSRSSSPSLEHAILAERMRRAASGTTGSPVPKGTRFKSSPLTGDWSGVVVAEHVKQDSSRRAMSFGEVNGRIPSEKDKEGPDKEEL